MKTNETNNKYKYKNQPLIRDFNNCIRFNENRIISKLVEIARRHGYDLSEIAKETHSGKFSQGEVEQLLQLIGYSVSGFCDLELVTKTSKAKALRALKTHVNSEQK